MKQQHLPNPFDFVPFSVDPPVVKPYTDWMQDGPLCTGYFEVTIQALTPVHIVGNQESEMSSSFYRRDDQPLIPSSTIRGCLRSFIECVCNCWASQLTPYYEKKKDNRHIGFMVNPHVKEPEDGKNICNKLEHAVPECFCPDMENKEYLDIASFLFGAILPSGSGFKGRIMIEDAFIDSACVSDNKNGTRYMIPDIKGSAFMGGAKASASSWWYMYPFGIRKRFIKKRNIDVCEFIGKGFRGRKFYFHQNPESCVEKYFKSNSWKNLHQIPFECLHAGKETRPFRIYFRDLPQRFLDLLLFALFPGKRIRHKFGYGKPYGYGSVEFQLSDGSQRFKIKNSGGISEATIDSRLNILRETCRNIEQLAKQIPIHLQSLEKLAKILYFDTGYSFTYPPFGEGGFQKAVKAEQIKSFIKNSDWQKFEKNSLVELTREEGKQIAKELILADRGFRHALDFEVYQEESSKYDEIMKRSFV